MNILPDNLKENDLDIAGFQMELVDGLGELFDIKLKQLYDALNIKSGDITPAQKMRLTNIIDLCATRMTDLAIELAAQNKKTLPRCEEYDSILKVLHKMYDDYNTEDDEKAESFFNSKFTLGFGDVNTVICNGASQYEIVEGSLLRLLEETAEYYGDGYDYSDPIVTLENGEAKPHYFTEG